MAAILQQLVRLLIAMAMSLQSPSAPGHQKAAAADEVCAAPVSHLSAISLVECFVPLALEVAGRAS